MWRLPDIAQIATHALKARNDALRLEQAVRGLDAMDEVEFHPLLAAGFESAGYGVVREHPYPGEPQRRPRHAQRERCDLVLTPSRGTPIRDPVAELRTQDAAAGTLFEPLAQTLSIAPGIPPAEALWLEVKLVGQFSCAAGIPGPNASYTSELLTLPAADIRKLSRDGSIRHAALLLIHFSEDQAIAEHDLGVFLRRCLERNLPIGTPELERFPVADRIGNRLCTLVLVPVRPN
jgi:hypothetical protein